MSSHNHGIIEVIQRPQQNAEQNPQIHVVLYECKWDERGDSCGKWIEWNTKEIRKHLRNSHAVGGRTIDFIQCKWTTCTDQIRYGSVSHHVAAHFKVTLHCSTCRMSSSRCDGIQNHLITADTCANSDVLVVHGPGARRIVLPSDL